jgi:hypothetical protein
MWKETTGYITPAPHLQHVGVGLYARGQTPKQISCLNLKPGGFASADKDHVF